MSTDEGFHFSSFIFNSCVWFQLQTFNESFRKAKLLGQRSIDKLKMFILFLNFDLIFLKNLNFIFKFFDLIELFFVTED